MPLREGEKFADFTVVRLLGSGGMGEVYLVKHPRLPRFEALKILPQEVSADAAFRERFHREAELAASLSHPHIVGVHDQGECDGQLWISMEFIDGSDSAQLLRHRYPGGFDRDEAIAIVTTIAGALDHAHNRGLLHRDVKPANILVGSGGTTDQRIMLADFGIARRINDISGLTATNIVVGTVTYAAPEQLMGSDIDGRADQYALAATAYELLCGEPPFKHPNPVVVIGHHLNSAPPRLGAANPELAGLDGALSRALAKERTARFGCCLEFAAALTTGSPSSPNASRASAPPQVTLPTMASPTLVPMYDQNTVMGPARPSRTPTAQPPSDQARKSVGAVTARKTVRKRTIMASALVTVALATISALGIIKLGHQNPVDTSQQDRVRATVNKFDAAVRSGDLAILRDVTCGAAHDGYMRYDDQAWSQAYSRVAEMKQYPVIASIDKVVVNGQHAEANVTTFMAYDPQLRSTRSLDLQYRDDQWKICQSPSG